MTGRSFVSKVGSTRSLNVPIKFADHHDIQQGDTIEVKVVSHKRDGETLYEENNES